MKKLYSCPAHSDPITLLKLYTIVLFESLIIFLIEIKIKLKTEFDFSVFLILSTVPRTLQALNTYIIHSSVTY